MPIYVYECKKCHRTFETQQRMSDAPLEDCECGAQGSLRRLIQPTAIVFRGAGFHINDYDGSKKDAPTNAPSGQEVSTKPKEEAASPEKPAETPSSDSS